MNRQQAEEHYKAKGLEVEYGYDKPGSVYEPHTHEQTFLYTLKGSLKVRLDGGDWQLVGPGEEFVIGTGQLHEAVVGDDGWEYVTAWDEQEAARFDG